MFSRPEVNFQSSSFQGGGDGRGYRNIYETLQGQNLKKNATDICNRALLQGDSRSGGATKSPVLSWILSAFPGLIIPVVLRFTPASGSPPALPGPIQFYLSWRYNKHSNNLGVLSHFLGLYPTRFNFSWVLSALPLFNFTPNFAFTLPARFRFIHIRVINCLLPQRGPTRT
jgi:hypothetical protein